MRYKKNRKSRTGDIGTLEERRAYYESCPKCNHCTYNNKNADKDGFKFGLPKAFKDKWKLLAHYNLKHPDISQEIRHLFEDDEIVTCPICNQFMGQIGHKHLAKHNLTTDQFKRQYPDSPMRPIKMKQVWSDRCKEFNKTEYMKKKSSEGNRKYHFNKSNGPIAQIKGRFYSEKNKKEIPYRSNYELIAFKLLEEDDSINSYEYEKLKIRYYGSDKKVHTYYPDIITDNNRIIEAKAGWILKEENVKYSKDVFRKFAAAEKWAKKNGYTFEVWTEKELGILES